MLYANQLTEKDTSVDAAEGNAVDTSSPPAHPTAAANVGVLSSDRLLGRVFNKRFRIHSLIARGGMGKVYQAVQIPLGRLVALKVLHPLSDKSQQAAFHRRFFLEASIAAQLNHPHTVTVFDFGQTDDGIYYLAMEYLQGVCLRQALHTARLFSPQRALHIALQVVQALSAAHALGAIHRDLKPANIFLLPRQGSHDFVKVLDFGLVKNVVANDEDPHNTQPGKFLGSPGYMAPEQIHGKTLDGRCDIYAVGVLLYEMLTGRPPFVCTSPLETMMAHVHDPLPPLHVAQPHMQIPPQLEHLVRTCLAKEATARYANMDALAQALTELLGSDTALPSAHATPSYHSQALTTAVRLPTRLNDSEQSGWSVVSSTGVLAIPKIAAAPPSPTAEWDAVAHGSGAAETLLDCTLAMSATPSDELPTQLGLLPQPSALASEASAAPVPKLAAAVAWSATSLLAPKPQRRVTASARRRWRTAVSLLLSLTLLGGLGRMLWQRRADWRGEVTIQLQSSPAGAQAFVNQQEVCAATPCQVQLHDVAPQQAYSVSFRLPQHDEFVASRLLDKPNINIRARLQRSTQKF